MREILFKAKRKDNGEWIHWNLWGELIRESGKRTRITVKNSATTSYYDYVHQIRHLIDESTLCQYTGLTDKNGRKVWENDIVYIPYISLDDTYCRVVFRHGTFIGELADGCEDCITNRKAEVIGNYFDNPELLKEGAE